VFARQVFSRLGELGVAKLEAVAEAALSWDLALELLKVVLAMGGKFIFTPPYISSVILHARQTWGASK
jgi:hypothetical protein